jgi:hypothetical protein
VKKDYNLNECSQIFENQQSLSFFLKMKDVGMQRGLEKEDHYKFLIIIENKYFIIVDE